MQPDPLELARRWFQQGSDDLEDAGISLEAARYHVACFFAQQSAEKTLKALLYWTAGDYPRRHLIATLLEELAESPVHVPDEIAAGARALDKYYMTTRYPDVLDYALPTNAFHRDEAERAIAYARDVRDFVGDRLPKSP